MRSFLCLMGILAAALSPTAAHAKDEAAKPRKPSSVQCPSAGEDNSLDKTVAMVKAAASCYEADQIATQCAWGDSADGQIAGAAGDVCAKAFKGKLTAQDKTMYTALIKKCQKKYANLQGTMYISFESFCEESVGKLFNEFYTPAE